MRLLTCTPASPRSPEIRGGLTDVAKVLQNLFNLLLFTDPEKGYMFCVNQYIEASKKKVELYLDKVSCVALGWGSRC
jgi:hypothetical protein